MDGTTALIYYTLNVGELNTNYQYALPLNKEQQMKFMEDMIMSFNAITNLLFFKTRLI